MKKNILPPLAALVCGAVGFALRKWQLSTGFESDTGLAIPGAPAALALIGWSVLTAVAIFLMVRPHKARMPMEAAFGDGVGNTAYLALVLLSAVLLLVSAGAEAVTVLVAGQTGTAATATDSALAQAASAALPPLRVLLCFGGLLAAGLWGRKLYRGEEGRRESLSIVELCLLFCVWLISDYQTRAADPVVLDYAYEVFAIVTALLGLYYLAGWAFQTGQPRRTLFFSLLGVYFSLVTLADSHTLAELTRCGFAVLFLTAHAALLLNPTPAELPAEETEARENA